MKPIALKELQEAIRILNYTAGDICPSTTENAKEDIQNALKHIQAAIFSETPNTSRKFDLYKFASNDEIRPVMNGVFHDQGYKVASDCHVLVAVKEAYDEALEHHILGRTGDDIIGKYPMWQSIFPQEVKGEKFEIDSEKVYELLKAVKAEKKAAGKGGIVRRGYVKVGETFFAVESMAKLCTFMDAYGCHTLTIENRLRAAGVYAPDGSKALIMPVAYCQYHDEAGYLQDGDGCMTIFEKLHDKALWYEAA